MTLLVKKMFRMKTDQFLVFLLKSALSFLWNLLENVDCGSMYWWNSGSLEKDVLSSARPERVHKPFVWLRDTKVKIEKNSILVVCVRC